MMNWHYDRTALSKRCSEHRIEFVEAKKDNKIIFMCPKMPDKKVKHELSSMIPKDVDAHFFESLKVSTADAITVLLKGIGFAGALYESLSQSHKRVLFIRSEMGISKDNSFWKEIPELLHKDGYFAGWNITLGKKSIVYNREITKKIQQHGKRGHTINEDDIDKLKITLGRKLDVLQFIKEMS